MNKIPNLNIVMAFAAQHIKVPYGKFVTDYRLLVEGKIKVAEDFGIDVVSCISDPWREAASFGAEIIIPEDDVPFCKNHLLGDLDRIGTLKPADPMDSERMLDRIRAVELFAQQVKNVYPIVGWVEGCLAEAADLHEIQAVMMDLLTEPEALTELFEIIYLQQKRFAAAQISAGADIIGIGNAAASLIGPALYEEFVLEYDRRIVRDIHAMGAKAELHICGNIGPLLDLLVQTETDILDVDHMVDFGKAVAACAGTRTCVSGNLDPVTVFLNGTPETVRTVVEHCLALADETTMIAGGCEIPRKTPYENMYAMNAMLALAA
ncbi:MAG: uroporphyrinogen decarboxylase family protein [Propionivibrio sp.]